jgi:Kef-type K+ transport system membrane component KefB
MLLPSERNHSSRAWASVDVNRILLDILIVLVAAKLAAEVAERLKLPAVVAEIGAGILVGPSVFGLVHESDALATLAELGVILLLLEVGMEMDLKELGSVGRASLLVAVAGIVVPMATGFGAGFALGMDGKEALFVGAALTATSVGITARVFGDLRALASVEARTVLGAAVADDILGLVILTVVTRIVTEGTVDPFGILGIIVIAIGFVVVATLIGIRFAPPAFAFIRRYSRSAGTLVAIALAFTLAISELAHAAQLAPIVGAFVAGLALGRSSAAHRVRRELAPVGHLLIPVFFLQIGIEAEVGQFVEPKVLGLAAVLLVVAILGKLASVIGLIGSPGDRWLIGIGMVPRGEVGLIFATLGLNQGVFGNDVYAALLLVVLVTTVATPPALRWRLLKLRSKTKAANQATIEPGGEIVRVGEQGEIEMLGEPAASDALAGALTIARLSEEHPLGSSVLEWLNEYPSGPRRWDDRSRAEFWRMLRDGGPRSWRLLSATGILQSALPEIDDALSTNRADAFDIDPLGALHFRRVYAVRRALKETGAIPAQADAVLLAAFVLDACDDTDLEPVVVGRRTVARLDLGLRIEQIVATIITETPLVTAAVRRHDALEEQPVLELAIHLESVERAEAVAFFARATFDGDPWAAERLDELTHLLYETLSRPDLVDQGAMYEVDRRRHEAFERSLRAPIRERIQAAPREYVLQCSADDLIRHAQLVDPAPRRNEVRVLIEDLAANEYRIEFATQDQLGLMARTSRALLDARCSVTAALAVTWGDGAALSSYRVVAPARPIEDDLAEHLSAIFDEPLESRPIADVAVTFDNDGSPWYTRCEITAPDRRGLLNSIATAFAFAETNVHSARIATAGTEAADRFELTLRSGGKLDARAQDMVATALQCGVVPGRRRLVSWTRRRPAETLSIRSPEPVSG